MSHLIYLRIVVSPNVYISDMHIVSKICFKQIRYKFFNLLSSFRHIDIFGWTWHLVEATR